MKSNVSALAIFNVSAAVLVSACAGGGSSSSEPQSSPQAAVSSTSVAPIELPRFAEAKSCVYEKIVNGKKFIDQRTLARVTENRVIWDSKKDGAPRSTVELDVNTAEVVKDYALSNDQRISFSPPYKWADFPISIGKTWESKSRVTGETFVSDIEGRFVAIAAERIKVPAGEFDTIKVEGKESIRSGGTTGSGTITYWVSSASKCVVKVTYSNTYREKGQAVLVASE